MIVLPKPQTLKEQISEKGICFFDVKVELGDKRVKGEGACSAPTPLASKCCAGVVCEADRTATHYLQFYCGGYIILTIGSKIIQWMILVYIVRIGDDLK